MKKWSIIMAVLVSVIACDDIGHSPLKGKWQLRTVDRAGVVTVVDTVWYNFQSESIFTIQIYRAETDTYAVATGFRHESGAALSIEMLAGQPLSLTDWRSPKRDFTVVACSGGKLTLQGDEGSVYRFTKF